MSLWREYMRWQRLLVLMVKRNYHTVNAYLYWNQGQSLMASDAECRALDVQRQIDELLTLP